MLLNKLLKSFPIILKASFFAFMVLGNSFDFCIVLLLQGHFFIDYFHSSFFSAGKLLLKFVDFLL